MLRYPGVPWRLILPNCTLRACDSGIRDLPVFDDICREGVWLSRIDVAAFWKMLDIWTLWLGVMVDRERPGVCSLLRPLFGRFNLGVVG